jgi:hypothetical protein
MSTTRRKFVLAGGLGAAATLGWARPAAARDLTATEKANVKVVNDFSAAWATGDAAKVASYLTDDCVVRFLQTQEPVKGRATVTERLKAGMQNSKIEFEVHESFAIGSLVANYRTTPSPARTASVRPFASAASFTPATGRSASGSIRW